MTRWVLALVAAAAIAAAGGCGGKHDTIGKGASHKPEASQRASTDTGASRLRSHLTALLTDHVYLTAFAATTGLASGFRSPAAQAATATAQRTAADLAKTVEAAYGAAAASKFAGVWQSQIGSFADYAKAKAGGRAAAVQAADRDLDSFRRRLGAFVAHHDPRLPKGAVAVGLEAQVVALLQALDAAAQRSPAVFPRLERAARTAGPMALALAGGIAQQFSKTYDGGADDAPATLRATLTGLLENHVYLAGIAIRTGVASGLASPAFRAATATLDGNSVALSKTFGSVYGPSAARRFLALWRSHIGFFADYAKAQLGHDRGAAQQALAELDGSRRAFGELISAVNPNLSAGMLAAALEPHIATLAGAIRAAVKKSPQAFARLRQAALPVPAIADLLAAGIAKQFPDRFPAA